MKKALAFLCLLAVTACGALPPTIPAQSLSKPPVAAAAPVAAPVTLPALPDPVSAPAPVLAPDPVATPVPSLLPADPAPAPIRSYRLIRYGAADRPAHPGCSLALGLGQNAAGAEVVNLKLTPTCPDDDTISVRLTSPQAVTPQNPYGDLYGVGWHGGAGSASMSLPDQPGHYTLREVNGSPQLATIDVI